MVLPKRLKKEPLIEAIWTLGVEIQDKKRELLPGILYNHLKNRFRAVNTETKPHYYIPGPLRIEDTILSKVPYIIFSSENIAFLWKISDKSISISAIKPYPGWEALYEEIGSLLKLLLSEELITRVEWISFRYIDLIQKQYMEGLQGLKLELKLGGWTLEDSKLLIDIEKQEERYTFRLTIVNPAEIIIQKESLHGCLIDTEVYLKVKEESPSEEFILAESALIHDIAKRLFFEHIVKDELIQKLEPEV